MRFSFRRADVRLDWEIEAKKLPFILGVSGRIEQVLVNLLQNALDATIDRDSPRVLVLVRSNSDFVFLTVDDNGLGLKDDIADKVFMPFVTGKETGMGLGLGISRDIARDYGGEIDKVTSRLGGAAFEVRLNRYKGAEST